MSSASKLTLPLKFQNGFSNSNALIDEAIELCERHDHVHLLVPQAESEWKPIQQSKLDAILMGVDPLSQVAIARDSELSSMRAEIQRNVDELDIAKERYMAACNVLLDLSLREHPDQTELDKVFADAKTYSKAIQEFKEVIAQLERSLEDLQKSHALRAANTPKSSGGPAFNSTNTL